MYSDQIVGKTDAIDGRLLRLIGKAAPSVGYIPSSSDPERFFFDQICTYYAALGASVDVYLELDTHFFEDALPTLSSCDAIHLSGGNTSYFLYWLKQRAMLPVLREYVAGGGVLIGVSAGAVLMTPDVSTSALCGDALVEGLSDLSALGLVDFQFLPHFEPGEADIAEIEAHQRRFSTTLYACPDGGGIVVDGADLEFFGEVRRFESLQQPGASVRRYNRSRVRSCACSSPSFQILRNFDQIVLR